jgi:enoyl-CoA hydratase
MRLDESRFPLMKFRRDGAVLTASFNRPQIRNAFNHQLHLEFSRFLLEVNYDSEIRVVVLTGEGVAFSAGGDMSDPEWTPAVFAEQAVAARNIVFGLLDCTKLVICRLNGDAIGLGASVALLCDFAYAVPSVRIGDPHVKMGLVAGDGGALIWPHLLGPMRAKYYLLTGDLVAAPEAEKMGLITRCVPPDALDQEVYGLADRLVAGAGLAQQWTKRAANAHLKSLAALQFDMSLGYEGITVVSHDHAEAKAAFIAKRKPEFKGN